VLDLAQRLGARVSLDDLIAVLLTRRLDLPARLRIRIDDKDFPRSLYSHSHLPPS
jgi:hypothetical protein